MLEHLAGAVGQRAVLVLEVAQRQRPVAAQVDVPDLDVGLAAAEVVLLRQQLAHPAVAALVVNGRHLDLRLLLVVVDREQAQVAHQLRAQVLADEALVLEVAHRVVERRQPRRARQLGEPLAVLLGRVLADALDVVVHREAQRVGVDAAVAAVADARLVDHVGVRLQPLDHHAVGQPALVVHGVEQLVVPEGGPAFVHHLALALRVEVLRDLAHDAHQLALPGLEQRRVLLDEVQQVLLRLLGKAAVGADVVGLLAAARQRAPQVVDLLLRVGLALLALGQLLRERLAARAAVAVDAVVHQRMAAVEEKLDGVDAVALLAGGDIVLGVDEVVDDRRRIRPHPEQVVALEEAVVAVGGMRDHQRLHRHRVLLHQVADAGVGVDDDLVGQAHVAAAIVLLGRDELLAVAPVTVVHRHADRGVGVHHLLGGDDLELVRIGVDAEARGRAPDDLVIALDQLEVPVALARQRLGRALAGRQRAVAQVLHRDERMALHAAAPSFLNRSRKTG